MSIFAVMAYLLLVGITDVGWVAVSAKVQGVVALIAVGLFIYERLT